MTAPLPLPDELRREREPDEPLLRCVQCGRFELPLNDREMWHYVRTGKGLVQDCSKHKRGWHKWERL